LERVEQVPWTLGCRIHQLWRFWDVSKYNHHWTQIALHRKHGDVVRLGPNVLSFADPRAIKAIYGLNKGVYKVCAAKKEKDTGQ